MMSKSRHPPSSRRRRSGVKTLETPTSAPVTTSRESARVPGRRKRRYRKRTDAAWTRSVADRLREAWRDSELSQEDFASEIGVPRTLATGWFNAVHQPSLYDLVSIARKYGVSLDWLAGFDDVPKMRLKRSTIGVLAEEVRGYLEKAAFQNDVPTEARAALFDEPEVLIAKLARYARRRQRRCVAALLRAAVAYVAWLRTVAHLRLPLRGAPSEVQEATRLSLNNLEIWLQEVRRQHRSSAPPLFWDELVGIGWLAHFDLQHRGEESPAAPYRALVTVALLHQPSPVISTVIPDLERVVQREFLQWMATPQGRAQLLNAQSHLTAPDAELHPD